MKKKNRVISKEQAALLMALMLRNITTDCKINTDILERQGWISALKVGKNVTYSKGLNFPKEMFKFTVTKKMSIKRVAYLLAVWSDKSVFAESIKTNLRLKGKLETSLMTKTLGLTPYAKRFCNEIISKINLLE